MLLIELSQVFRGLSVYCGCKMNWAAASQVALCKKTPSLQLVCNQGNHSLVKTTNLFLQYRHTGYR